MRWGLYRKTFLLSKERPNIFKTNFYEGPKGRTFFRNYRFLELQASDFDETKLSEIPLNGCKIICCDISDESSVMMLVSMELMRFRQITSITDFEISDE